MKEQEIGELYKGKLSGYEAQPPQSVWDGIAKAPAVKRFNRARQFRYWGLRAGIPALFTAAVITAVVLLQPNPTSKVTPTPQSTPTTAQIVDTGMTQQNSTPTVAPVQTVAPVRTVQATTPTTVSENSSPVEIAPATAENLPVATTTAIPDPTPIPSSPTIAQPKLLTLGGNGKPDGHTKPNATVNPEQEAIQNTEYQPVAIKEDSRLTYSHDTLVCRNSKLTLFVNNAEQVYWSFGSDLASVDLIVEENTRVEAMVHTKDGKDTTIRVSITVCDCELFIPTAFTPNGDGLNDEWMVYAPAGITDFECMIYDKLGNMMFHTRNIHQGWNGTNNGNLLPAGGYFYSCRYRDELGQPHVQKGQLTLVR